MKLITKIRKAKDQEKKTEIFQEADLSVCDIEDLVKDMILSLPGDYKLHSREFGANLVDTVYDAYGLTPSRFITESMLLGLQVSHPKQVYASFTLGLDAITIRL